MDFPPRWTELNWSQKYVDDLSAGEKACIANCVSTFSQNKEERLVWSPFCQELHVIVESNCERVGMKMNTAKTQLLCITSAINYEVRSYIESNGRKIVSGDELKLLGFTFGRRPTVRPHFESVRRKYAIRTHSIRHLKKIGIKNDQLVRIYSAMILPVIEYTAPIYHHMLSDELRDDFERLQRQIFKIIYGFDTPYRQALEMSGMASLEDRRKELALSFALNAEKNPKYAHWFPLHPRYTHNIREQAKYREDFALRDRMKNSPVFSMRRILNEHYAKVGAKNAEEQ